MLIATSAMLTTANPGSTAWAVAGLRDRAPISTTPLLGRCVLRHGAPRPGIRIRSGASRSYYIGVESAMPAVPGLAAPLKALCVVPFGMEEGTAATIQDREFGLIVGEPAEFRFLSSTVRKSDPPGALIEDWGEDIEELGPLEVTLTLDGKEDVVVPITLESHVTEVGTLELWCVDARSEPAVEAGAEHPGAGRLTSLPTPRAGSSGSISAQPIRPSRGWMRSVRCSRACSRFLQLVAAGEVGRSSRFLRFCTCPPWRNRRPARSRCRGTHDRRPSPEYSRAITAHRHPLVRPRRRSRGCRIAQLIAARDCCPHRVRRIEALARSGVSAPPGTPAETRGMPSHASEGMLLQDQAIVLTVPASFDEEARELTVEAARDAGFGSLTLLEEPLAAVYAWMSEPIPAPSRNSARASCCWCAMWAAVPPTSACFARTQTRAASVSSESPLASTCFWGETMSILRLPHSSSAGLRKRRPQAGVWATERQALRRHSQCRQGTAAECRWSRACECNRPRQRPQCHRRCDDHRADAGRRARRAERVSPARVSPRACAAAGAGRAA